MKKATMNKTASKGLLLAGTLLGMTACGTVPTPLAYDSVRLIAQPFALRSNDLLLERRVCAASNQLMLDCEQITTRSNNFRFQDNVRDNVYDNLSDKLFASGGPHKKSRWRLKKDRVEWQYKF